MDLARSKLIKTGIMLRTAIAHVACKIIAWIHLIIFYHHTVSCHLCNDTCRRNTCRQRISLDDRHLLDIDLRDTHRIINKRSGCTFRFAIAMRIAS